MRRQVPALPLPETRKGSSRGFLRRQAIHERLKQIGVRVRKQFTPFEPEVQR
jgi:hypothetical protein